MNIVVLDGHTLSPGDNPWGEVEKLGKLMVHPRTTPTQVVERAAHADIILTNKVAIDSDLIASLPKLKFISVLATGYNVVDVAAAAARNIPVSNVPEYSTQSVAQHVFATILAWIHRPELHDQACKDGEWENCDDFSFSKSPVIELAGKTMGIVGLGRIGRATAKLANAFGMTVVASSRTEQNPLPYDGFRWLSQEALFTESDYVSLHCPQTESNTKFVNEDLLGSMKPTAILINTARGGLIDEQDLATALNTNRIGGAILDVVSQEPIKPDNPLLTARRCRLTPHMAWTALESRHRLMSITANNIRQFISGIPVNVVS